MASLRPVGRLVVDIAIDNLSDNYSSKPQHVSPEFNNVIAAGAPTLRQELRTSVRDADGGRISPGALPYAPEAARAMSGVLAPPAAG